MQNFFKQILFVISLTRNMTKLESSLTKVCNSHVQGKNKDDFTDFL